MADETIDDVLDRVKQLTKPEMTEEAEAYGLEVHASWTKEEIMENLEKHLVSASEEGEDDEDDAPAVEETDFVEPDSFEPVSDEVAAGEPGEEDTAAGEIRVARSRGWGHNAAARTP